PSAVRHLRRPRPLPDFLDARVSSRLSSHCGDRTVTHATLRWFSFAGLTRFDRFAERAVAWRRVSRHPSASTASLVRSHGGLRRHDVAVPITNGVEPFGRADIRRIAAEKRALA